MKLILSLILSLILVTPAFAKDLTIACKLFDNSVIGGTYYEANIVGKNTIANFKVINVTGGISTTLSSQKGPFPGVGNSLSTNPHWKNYVSYSNVTQANCRYNDCTHFTVPADLPSLLGRKFNGYVTLKRDEVPGTRTIVCQVY